MSIYFLKRNKFLFELPTVLFKEMIKLHFKNMKFFV